eukprot:786683-Rhodomonas_salina.1
MHNAQVPPRPRPLLLSPLPSRSLSFASHTRRPLPQHLSALAQALARSLAPALPSPPSLASLLSLPAPHALVPAPAAGGG